MLTLATPGPWIYVSAFSRSYMAVCGLPVERADHASRMADFALGASRADSPLRLSYGIRHHGVSNKLLSLTNVLRAPSASAGMMECAKRAADVTGVSLAMRVGMHSGSVVAGVIRADKSRFQLFGDTVNMAARMEGTGEPGRVQVSEASFELLREANTHVLTCRGRVEAKGKGAVTTYFLEKRMGWAERRRSTSLSVHSLLSGGDRGSLRGSVKGTTPAPSLHPSAGGGTEGEAGSSPRHASDAARRKTSGGRSSLGHLSGFTTGGSSVRTSVGTDIRQPRDSVLLDEEAAQGSLSSHPSAGGYLFRGNSSEGRWPAAQEGDDLLPPPQQPTTGGEATGKPGEKDGAAAAVPADIELGLHPLR